MRSIVRAIPFVLLVLALAVPAAAWTRGTPTTFATLPPGEGFPEGITADADGNLYVTTFNVAAPAGRAGQLFVFGRDGRLVRQVPVAGSSAFLLGVEFHPGPGPTRGRLLVVDFGAQAVRDVDPLTGASSVFTTIPGGAAAGPNALAFDAGGNVYVSDSFQGVIWRVGPAGGDPTAWASSELLRTSGVPPFGANGLAFNGAGTDLFVANTGNDTVVRIPAADPGAAAVFVNSINGADGLIIDEDDRLWVAANQGDEIVVVEPKEGRVVAKLGDFDGLDPRGAPRGFLFPASLVRSDGFLYVTNLALDLRLFGLAPPVDAPWTGDVDRYTIARIRARIPPVDGRP